MIFSQITFYAPIFHVQSPLSLPFISNQKAQKQV